jgi:hypothetical protein
VKHRTRRGFVLGFAAGYVAGAAAGRERYDDIVRVVRSIRMNPQIRRTAASAQELVRRRVSSVGDGGRPGMDRMDESAVPAGRDGEFANLAGPGVNVS